MQNSRNCGRTKIKNFGNPLYGFSFDLHVKTAVYQIYPLVYLFWRFESLVYILGYICWEELLVGWTAWPIWKNRENSFKERWKKVKKCAKNTILQKNTKNTPEAKYLKYDA